MGKLWDSADLPHCKLSLPPSTFVPIAGEDVSRSPGAHLGDVRWSGNAARSSHPADRTPARQHPDEEIVRKRLPVGKPPVLLIL